MVRAKAPTEAPRPLIPDVRVALPPVRDESGRVPDTYHPAMSPTTLVRGRLRRHVRLPRRLHRPAALSSPVGAWHHRRIVRRPRRPATAGGTRAARRCRQAASTGRGGPAAGSRSRGTRAGCEPAHSRQDRAGYRRVAVGLLGRRVKEDSPLRGSDSALAIDLAERPCDDHRCDSCGVCMRTIGGRGQREGHRRWPFTT